MLVIAMLIIMTMLWLLLPMIGYAG